MKKIIIALLVLILFVTPVTSFAADTLSSDFTLKSLEVTGFELLHQETGSKEFDPESKNYTVIVPFSITTLPVEAVANCEKATVTVYDAALTYVGTNIVRVTVTAENGAKRTYKIYATRLAPDYGYEDTSSSEAVSSQITSSEATSGSAVIIPPVNNRPSGDFTLKSLRVRGFAISQKDDHTKGFDPEVKAYVVTVPFSVEKLNVEAVATHKKATVKISEEKLEYVGTNITKILVTAENGSKRTYKIYTTRLAPEENTAVVESEIKQNGSTNSSTQNDSNTDSNTDSKADSKTESSAATSGAKTVIPWWIWIIVVLLIAAIGVLIFIIVKRNKI